MPRDKISGEQAGRKKGQWGMSDGEKRGIGVELTEVPLCKECSDEAVGEGEDPALEKGLELATKKHWGSSKDKLQMLSDELEGGVILAKEEKSQKNRNRGKGKGEMRIEQDLKRFINKSAESPVSLTKACYGLELTQR